MIHIRSRRVGAVLAGVGGAVMAVFLVVLVLSGGDLVYAWRVLAYQESDTRDTEWKASVPIPATDPRPWPAEVDCAPVNAALRATGADGLDDWLHAGGGSAFVVIQNGVLTCEDYADGITASSALPVFSVSKTLTSLLLSRAVEEGVVDYDDSIVEYLPELAERDARFADITLGDLVDMRSGIAFTVAAGFPFLDQDAARVYYATDLRAALLRYPEIVAAPGTFAYNDYAPNLIGLALERAGQSAIGTDMSRLWQQLGAQDGAKWLVDDAGFAWHESGLVASARDLARVGELLLDGGQADGRPVAPDAFLARTQSRGGAETVQSLAADGMGYANGWWVLDSGRSYVALGRYGQLVVVHPKTRTVIVRLGVEGYEGHESDAAIARRLTAVAEQLGGSVGDD
ncbi:serine hydrolase [Cryobacterium sp. SO2]|uniref:serine hydrolase domain-containing protein n=1 Tax=Cryobacterium sp. SO2 TaxID=1897060 RepID=UPI00223DEAA7|nr:serine hydrolase [Cryobacterium sp. SO2]WEO78770.1 serine hydrolase [Cryobacterium sp. SO2]